MKPFCVQNPGIGSEYIWAADAMTVLSDCQAYNLIPVAGGVTGMVGTAMGVEVPMSSCLTSPAAVIDSLVDGVSGGIHVADHFQLIISILAAVGVLLMLLACVIVIVLLATRPKWAVTFFGTLLWCVPHSSACDAIKHVSAGSVTCINDVCHYATDTVLAIPPQGTRLCLRGMTGGGPIEYDIEWVGFVHGYETMNPTHSALVKLKAVEDETKCSRAPGVTSWCHNYDGSATDCGTIQCSRWLYDKNYIKPKPSEGEFAVGGFAKLGYAGCDSIWKSDYNCRMWAGTFETTQDYLSYELEPRAGMALVIISDGNSTTAGFFDNDPWVTNNKVFDMSTEISVPSTDASIGCLDEMDCFALRRTSSVFALPLTPSALGVSCPGVCSLSTNNDFVFAGSASPASGPGPIVYQYDQATANSLIRGAAYPFLSTTDFVYTPVVGVVGNAYIHLTGVYNQTMVAQLAECNVTGANFGGCSGHPNSVSGEIAMTCTTGGSIHLQSTNTLTLEVAPGPQVLPVLFTGPANGSLMIYFYNSSALEKYQVPLCNSTVPSGVAPPLVEPPLTDTGNGCSLFDFKCYISGLPSWSRAAIAAIIAIAIVIGILILICFLLSCVAQVRRATVSGV